MKFRPCIDIHNGVVKQIIGSTLNDETVSDKDTSNSTVLIENFVAKKSAKEFARYYHCVESKFD